MQTIRAAIRKKSGKGYATTAPFLPDIDYPEFPARTQLDASNRIYGIVREVLHGLGLDSINFDTPAWNPLGDLVGIGQTVLIKPNLVLHSHPLGHVGLEATVAHPAVLRPLIDYACKAVGEEGKVIVGDTPLEGCDFDKLIKTIGLVEMLSDVQCSVKTKIELIDFRTYWTFVYPDGTSERINRDGDPLGYTEVDLGEESLLQLLESEFGEQNYMTLGDHTINHWDAIPKTKGLPNNYHYSGVHRYNIPNSVLDADLIVNVAKLKTHKKSGVTLCLKNCIGLSQGKEFLPHHRPGTPKMGGDSFASMPSEGYLRRMKLRRLASSVLGGKNARMLRDIFRRVVPYEAHKTKTDTMWGDWYGNDTIWRTTLDLSLVQLHANKQGVLDFGSQRSFLGIVDGIIGMDHEAPMAGLPRYSNIIIGARDPVASDVLGAFLMGFDPQKIPTIKNASLKPNSGLGSPHLFLDQVNTHISIKELQEEYIPNKGWKDHLLPHCNTWPYGQSA